MELDEVQSNRNDLIEKIRASVATMVDDWGIEVTRAEILDVNWDDVGAISDAAVFDCVIDQLGFAATGFQTSERECSNL